MFKQNLEKNFPTGLVRLNNKIFLHSSTLAKGSQTKKWSQGKNQPQDTAGKTWLQSYGQNSKG